MRDMRLFVKVLSGLSVFAVISLPAVSAYQWRCSPPNSDGSTYFPDIPAETGALQSVVTGITGISLLYVYPIPSSLTCSGTVVGVEFCYQAIIGDSNLRTIFTLLPLQRNGQQFTVNGAITVRSRPSNDHCTSGVARTCCGNVELSAQEQFQLSGDNFAFGIETPTIGGYPLLGFHSNTGYDVTGFLSASINQNTMVGSTFNPVLSMIQSLRVVRFVVASPGTSTTTSEPSTSEPSTSEPSTSEPSTSEPSTSTISTASIVTATTSSEVTTSESPTTMAPTTPGATDPATSSIPTTDPATSNPTTATSDPTTATSDPATVSTTPGSPESTTADFTEPIAQLAGDDAATPISIVFAFLIVIVLQLTIVIVVVIVMCVRKRTVKDN